MSEYASHYKHGSIETADKIEAVTELLGKSDMVASTMNECLPEGMEYGPTLADLIDRPTTTRHGKFKTKYGRETPCCEVCGYSIGDMRWNYCPKCGAVITDD